MVGPTNSDSAAACVVTGVHLWLMSLLTLLVVGCGSKEPRHAVHGTVHVDSAKVGKGSISFLPTGDTIGPAAATAIVDGEYEFTSENGPYAGLQRVVVGIEFDDSSQAAGAKDPKFAPKRARSKAGQRVWTTEFNVAAEGDIHKDFDFVSGLP